MNQTEQQQKAETKHVGGPISLAVVEQIDSHARAEQRSRLNMIEVLLSEALAARKRKSARAEK